MNLVAKAEIWCSVGLSQGWHGGAALRVGCCFLRRILQDFLEAERCCSNCLSEFIDHTLDRYVLFCPINAINAQQL